MHLEGTSLETNPNVDSRDLTCPICMSIADDPHLSSCCHRVFCAKDANPNRYDNGCPLCRETNYSFQPSSMHQSLLEQLTIKCACSERVVPEDYEAHRERCPDVTFLCPHTACREKNETMKYNSQQLVNHLARAHCDEVPLLGSNYINKKSLEPYKKAAEKYDELVSTLYSSLYPKMIEIQLSMSPKLVETSTFFKCPQGHQLVDVDSSRRKRKNGSVYSTPGFNCDMCHRTFSSGQSWHCSCLDSGYDKCVACLAFQLYQLDNDVLQQASEDNEEHQQRYRRRILRNTLRLPRGLLRLLTGNVEDVNDDDDPDALALRQSSPFVRQHQTFEGNDDEEIDVYLRED